MDRGARPRCSPIRGEREGVVARILARDGACADELCLMGVAREEVLVEWGIPGGGLGSDARNAISAKIPPFVERM